MNEKHKIMLSYFKGEINNEQIIEMLADERDRRRLYRDSVKRAIDELRVNNDPDKAVLILGVALEGDDDKKEIA